MSVKNLNEIATLNFYGDDINIVRDDQGLGWTPVKALCILLGLDWKSQLKKINDDRRFKCRLMTTVGADSKEREMVMLSIDSVHYWLSSVNVNKLTQRDGEDESEFGERVEKIIKYQQECGEALRDYWIQGVSLNRRDPEEVDVIDAAWRDFRGKSRQALVDAVKSFVVFSNSKGIHSDNDDVYYGCLNIISGRVLGRKLHGEDELMSGTDQQLFSTLENVCAATLAHYAMWDRDPSDILSKMHVHVEAYLANHPQPISDPDVLSRQLFSSDLDVEFTPDITL